MELNTNLRRVIAAVEQARSQNVSILCLPELCLTGYGCEDMFLAQHVLDTAWKMLLRLLPQTMGLAVTAGLPVLLDGHVYNAVAMLEEYVKHMCIDETASSSEQHSCHLCCYRVWVKVLL